MLRVDFCANRFRHTSHWYGLSPVWVRLWISRYCLHVKAAGHWRHWNGLPWTVFNKTDAINIEAFHESVESSVAHILEKYLSKYYICKFEKIFKTLTNLYIELTTLCICHSPNVFSVHVYSDHKYTSLSFSCIYMVCNIYMLCYIFVIALSMEKAKFFAKHLVVYKNIIGASFNVFCQIWQLTYLTIVIANHFPFPCRNFQICFTDCEYQPCQICFIE